MNTGKLRYIINIMCGRNMGMLRSAFMVMAMAGMTTSAATTDSLTIRIKGMRCDDCAHKIMNRLTQLKGVEDIAFNLERRTATIYYDAAKTCPDSLQAPLIGTRYNPTPYSAADVIIRGIGFKIEDMHCQKCANRIKECLGKVVGIDSVAPHVDKQYVFLRYDANKTDKETIRKALLEVGFSPVNYYTSDRISWAYYLVPAKYATKEYSDMIITNIMGVDDVVANPVRNVIAVTYDNKTVSADDLLKQIKKLGIKAKLPKPHVCKEEQGNK